MTLVIKIVIEVFSLEMFGGYFEINYIYFLGAPFMTVYDFSAAILRAILAIMTLTTMNGQNASQTLE